MKSIPLFALVSAMLGSGVSASAWALPLTGNLAVGVSTIGLSAAATDFSPNLANGGQFQVGQGSTGSFGALAGTTGIVSDLNIAGQPVGVPILMSNFVSLAVTPGAQFNLTRINPGVFTGGACGGVATVGQTCTPAGSQLNLVNTPSGAAVSFSVQGISRDAGTGITAPFTATFSTQFAGQSYQSLLASIGTGGILRAAYSATLTVPTGPLAGSLIVGPQSLGISNTTLDFSPAAAGAGSAEVGAASTGAFAALSGSALGIGDINLGAGSLADFISLIAAPTSRLTLDSLNAGLFDSAQCGLAAAVGQVCSVAGLPFSFVNLDGGSQLILSFLGRTLNTTTLESDGYQGILTAEFAGLSYQQVLAEIMQSRTVQAGYSMSIATGSALVSVPEPGSLALLLIALAGLADVRRRREARAG